MSAILDVNDLQTSYGSVNVLAGVSFSVQPGETYAMVGESGSGKTTVIRAIAGLAPAQAGSVKFDGQEIRGLSERAMRPLRKDIAMMFQDPIGSLSPRVTVRNLITEPYRIQGMKEKDIDAEAKRLLALVNLPSHFADRYPYQLSGGQARRVGVARALALEPKLILADEPTAGLDVSVQGELLNLLNDLRDRLGLSMVIITHNLNVVRHIADRMGILYLGRLVEEGSTEAIFDEPRHPYTHCLLSANPEPDPDAQLERIALKGEPPSLLMRPSGCEFRERCPVASDICLQTPKWEVNNDHGLRCLTPR
ncbi:ABC transporter ATP-binding protein [Halocynthiibacter styelae]|uniref:ABC transporter ATP-binding protein n=1 Tax=Halocynthiibacter styelae TaxID=2761955 RepID=A0A8J7LX98_9RHOB|nr:ABC transporter ATP-binding protein [Paenihalocynthiibacter styelae]MBI1495517.1 ABC transporter ATP-binding protein [Paenihalocynthiibacter styelae]